MRLVALSAACKEEGTITVKKLAFKGVTAVDESRLRAVLATKQSSIIPWGKKNYFDRSRFETDLKRIEAFYADRGYPDAHVTGFDVKLNDKQDAVDLTVTVSEGEPVKVAAVDFVGFDVIPPAHLVDLKNQIPLKVGQPRDRQLVVSTHELAINELRDHGFPYAKVTTQEQDGTNGKQASLTFVAEPGQVAYFGPVEISGNKSVGDDVIRRELAYKPGDLYRRSLVQDTQRRLYGMELFQFANVEPLNPELQPAEVPTRVTVAEGKHQRVNFGVGYGTEEKGRVDAEYHHVNFLGGARSAGAHVRWSSLDRGVRLDFNQPYLFRPHFSLGGEAQQWRTPLRRRTSRSSPAARPRSHTAPMRRTSWSISATSERDSSTVSPEVLLDPTLRSSLIALGLDPVTGRQDGTLNALGFDFQHSTADNVCWTRTAAIRSPSTPSRRAVSCRARSTTSRRRPMDAPLPPAGRSPRLCDARADRQHQRGWSRETNVPFSKKYFLGGATSVRGWGRYEISPLSSGLPIGGDSMLALSAELRAVLRGNFGGVVFIDAGNVWADAFGFKLNDLRYAIGPGLRYQTPVGPVRFDFGYQLNPIPGLLVNGQPGRRWRMHFSIGQAF